jgi:hypothetical protein
MGMLMPVRLEWLRFWSDGRFIWQTLILRIQN